MVGAITEGGVDHHETFRVVADIQLVRHAHAAMQLDGLAKYVLAISVNQDFESVDRLGRHLGILLVLTQRFKQQRLALLVGHHRIDHAVLKGLIRTNGSTELLAGLRVLKCLGIEHSHNAHRLGSQRDDGLFRQSIHDGQRSALHPTRHRRIAQHH